MRDQFTCDWCGSTGIVIGKDYDINDRSFMAVVKCQDCHHEWGAVVTKGEDF